MKQDKLVPRALRCIFVGYPKGIKGYRLWCTEPGNQKIIISRDITFKDEEFLYLQRHDKISNDTRKIDYTKFEVEPPRNLADMEDHDQIEDDVQDANDLRNYMLARDRTRRMITPPARFAQQIWFTMLSMLRRT